MLFYIRAMALLARTQYIQIYSEGAFLFLCSPAFSRDLIFLKLELEGISLEGCGSIRI